MTVEAEGGWRVAGESGGRGCDSHHVADRVEPLLRALEGTACLDAPRALPHAPRRVDDVLPSLLVVAHREAHVHLAHLLVARALVESLLVGASHQQRERRVVLARLLGDGLGGRRWRRHRSPM
eukprot:2074620-Prymnesium_polylepis.1